MMHTPLKSTKPILLSDFDSTNSLIRICAKDKSGEQKKGEQLSYDAMVTPKKNEMFVCLQDRFLRAA